MKELSEDIFDENRKDLGSFPCWQGKGLIYFLLFSFPKSVPFFVSVVSAAIKYNIRVNVTVSEVLKEQYDNSSKAS